MVAFPLIAALISAVFSIALYVGFSRRRRFSQLAWGVSLSMYALASLAVAAGVHGGWDKTLFKTYWLFGALLNVPYLALGSVALLRKRVLTVAMLLVVAAMTVFAFGVVIGTRADLSSTVRNPYTVPKGSEVWGPHALAKDLPIFYGTPSYFLVVGIALLSGRPRNGARPPLARVRGNWTIAGGATLVAAASSVARFARGSVLSVFLAVGITVMFAGFVMASRPLPDRIVSPRASDVSQA